MSRPAEVVWRGRVPAVGWLCPDSPAARARVIRAWTPGGRVLVGEGILASLPADPERIDRRTAPGEPLVRDRQTGALCTVPLDAPHPAAADDLVLARAGAATRIPRDALRAEDPATWLDLTGWQADVGLPLGPPPPPPEPVAADPPLAAAELFGAAAPAPDPEQGAVLEAQKARRAPPGPGQEVLARPPSWLDRVLARVARWLGAGSASGGAAGGGSGADGAPAGATRTPAVRRVPRPPRPSLLDRLQQWLGRSPLLTPLLQQLGRRQAEYMRKLLEAFDRGDLEDALRRAIPLGGEGDGPVQPAWGTPSLRTGALTPSDLAPASSGRAYGFGDSLYDRLQALYRTAAERLEAQGNIERAAFVLADLLHVPGEAVALLERHGLLELAAKIAEGRGLPPERVVRQWFLAGDAERALVIARRHGAFAAAIAALADDHPRKADALRLLQARLLAEQGDFVAAVAAVWPVESARRAARAWIDRGIAAGGSGGARLMIWKLAWFPDTLPELAPRLRALLDDDGVAGLPARRALQMALRTQKMAGRFPDVLRPVAERAVRSRLRDEAIHGSLPGISQVPRLLELAASPALGADLPNTPPAPVSSLLSQSARVDLHVPGGDVGTGPAHDAVLMPDGQLLVALGEAGVELLDPDGRPRWRCPEPAHRLIAPASGDRVLALARRGEHLWRVASLDLHRRASRHHRDLRLTAFAPIHQDGMWWAADGRTLSALDPLDIDLRALWRNRDVGGAIQSVVQGLEYVSWLTADPDDCTWFRLELGPLQLRTRTTVKPGETAVHLPLLRPDDGLVGLSATADGWEIRTRSPTRTAAIPDEAITTAALHDYGRDHVVAVLRVDNGSEVSLYGPGDLRERLRVSLVGSDDVRARLQAHHLVIWDERGRVLALDLLSGRLVAEHRT